MTSILIESLATNPDPFDPSQIYVPEIFLKNYLPIFEKKSFKIYFNFKEST